MATPSSSSITCTAGTESGSGWPVPRSQVKNGVVVIGTRSFTFLIRDMLVGNLHLLRFTSSTKAGVKRVGKSASMCVRKNLRRTSSIWLTAALIWDTFIGWSEESFVRKFSSSAGKSPVKSWSMTAVVALTNILRHSAKAAKRASSSLGMDASTSA